jgi:hypothetical protein
MSNNDMPTINNSKWSGPHAVHSIMNEPSRPDEMVRTLDTTRIKGQSEVVHMVKKGETLFSISRMYGVSISEIKRLNGILNEGIVEGKPLIIRIGHVINADTTSGSQVMQNKDTTVAILPSDEIFANTKSSKSIQTIRPKDGTKSYLQITEKGVADWAEVGWADGRYYCLHKSAPLGSIIKLTDNETGKSIYLKVMGNLSQSEPSSLIIRASNFARNKMGLSNKPFLAEITYSILD